MHSSIEACVRFICVTLQLWGRRIESSLLDKSPWADPTAWINIFALWGGRYWLMKADIIIALHLYNSRSEDRSVSIVTKLLEGQMTNSNLIASMVEEIFLFFTESRLYFGPILPFIQWTPGALSSGREVHGARN
jgi:hypothetical protein